MDAVILMADAARGKACQLQVENLDETWRCSPVQTAAQAMAALHRAYAEALILGPGTEPEALLMMLQERPLLSPPYVLGDGTDGPDGRLADAALLETWKREGRLPVLCGLRLEETTALARGMLRALGIAPGLRAWGFLPDMVALAVVHPPLLVDLQHGLYPLTARRHGMQAAAVERSLRLCVESTWSRGDLAALERFFGHSVDPERGKPTNREFLCRVQERVRIAAERLQR